MSALIVCLLVLYFTARNDGKKYRLEIQKYKHEIKNLRNQLSCASKPVSANPLDYHTIQRHKREVRDLKKDVSWLRRELRHELETVFPNPPPELYHGNSYWTKLSDYCRAEKKWTCEACQINLKHDTQYLDTHHKLGKGYNSPQHLKVLCVGCHAKEKTPIDHSFMKTDERYIAFTKKYWKYGR